MPSDAEMLSRLKMLASLAPHLVADAKDAAAIRWVVERLAELEAALKPFAAIAKREEYQPREYADGSRVNYPDGVSVGKGLTIGDFRRADATLSPTAPPKEGGRMVASCPPCA